MRIIKSMGMLAYEVRMKSLGAMIGSALAGLISLLLTTAANGSSSSISRPYYIGSSMFMLANFVPNDYPPKFYQVNMGYRITPNDTFSVEAMTWRYYHPLGIPLVSSRNSDNAYPGHVREYGIGLAYQRFLWEGLYSSLSAVPFWQQFFDSEGHKIRNGGQLFLTFRLGYHVYLTESVFLEPSIAITHWPISTNAPERFAALDKKRPSYCFEPGFHVGVEF